jgi:hypothetical protein
VPGALGTYKPTLPVHVNLFLSRFLYLWQQVVAPYIDKVLILSR